MDPEGGTGGQDPHPPGKSQVTISFLRNSGTDPPQEAIGEAIGPFASLDPLSPIASRRRSVRPSINTLMTKKSFQDSPLTRNFLDPHMNVISSHLSMNQMKS